MDLTKMKTQYTKTTPPHISKHIHNINQECELDEK